MKRFRSVLAPLALAVLAAPALAGGGILFKHTPKPDPKVRVPELLVVVKTDKDEHKRALAVEELRQYDAAAFAEIQPMLIDVLLNDAKPNVRAEAAQSLAKLRPVTQQVGWALEQALAKDASMWVRLQARTALLSYHWSGYHSSGKKDEAPGAQTNEPPMVKGPALTPIPTTPPTRLAPRPVNPLPPAPLPLPMNSDSDMRRVPPASTPMAIPPKIDLGLPPSRGPELSPPG